MLLRREDRSPPVLPMGCSLLSCCGKQCVSFSKSKCTAGCCVTCLSSRHSGVWSRQISGLDQPGYTVRLDWKPVLNKNVKAKCRRSMWSNCLTSGLNLTALSPGSLADPVHTMFPAVLPTIARRQTIIRVSIKGWASKQMCHRHTMGYSVSKRKEMDTRYDIWPLKTFS